MNLSRGRILSAEGGSFSLTGEAATLAAGRKLAAAKGSFSLTGEAAALSHGLHMGAAAGSFGLTGEAAGLVAGRKLVAAKGAFTLTGEAASFVRGHGLPAGQGAFALTGEAAGLRRTWKRSAAAGLFSLTGQDAGLTHAAPPVARTLTDAFIAQLDATVVQPVLFVEMEFSSGKLRLWSGVGTLTWNGVTWGGVGTLGGISPIQESSEVRANGVTFTLSGIATETLALALADARTGKAVKCWLGFIDTDGQVVADPSIAFAGRLDVPVIDDGADSATISISAENRLVDLERPRVRRYTPEDQKLRDPFDKGFDYVASIQNAQILWGAG